MRVLLRAVLLLILPCCPLRAQAPLARIHANDNRVPAGILKDGVLTLRLDVVRAMWHPDRDSDPGTDVLAFAEAGRAPSVPAPLIRVPVGTEIHTTVRNMLTDSAITLHGLAGARTPADSVRLRPGESRELVTRATSTGTFLYYAAMNARPDRSGDDRMLAGAFIVDGPNPRADRVLVVLEWRDTLRLKPFPGAVPNVLNINGKAWPFNERLAYDLGDTIRWRVVNGTFATHPMHLHGAYYSVLSRGGIASDTMYTAEQRRQVVTERMNPLTTMTMQWAPERAGNWLFHCHLTFHVLPHSPIGNVKAAHAHSDHTMNGMGGLIVGTTIRGRVAKDVRPRRHIRLVVNQYDSIAGDLVPPFSFELDDAKRMSSPGQAIVVTQNEPIAITVVNRAKGPTSVHWHGLEIESYYDGAAGYGGTPTRTTPLVGVNDSFVVKMTPPRAGTFIYHSHADEVRQQGGGLHGAFIVLQSGEKWDPARDRVILMASTRDTSILQINGEQSPTMQMKAGVTYRLRLINITLAMAGIVTSLSKGEQLEEWTPIARDGADLPAHQSTRRPAKLPITIGETDDVLYTPKTPGTYKFEARAGTSKFVRTATIVVTPDHVPESR